MTTRHRARLGRFLVPLVLVVFLAPVPLFSSGFQVMTQGARATGMGLAFTAVADDPSAIFYNPAGLGWQKHFEAEIGSSFLSKVKGDFLGANPYPGDGVVEKQHKTTFVLPTIYAVVPLTNEINFGLGVFAPYGLGYRWDNAETFSGRFISQNVVVQTLDLNPVISFQPLPFLAIAAGADYRFSKVMLERNEAAVNPFTFSVVDVAHVKLNSDLTDNHGWGWNAGILVKPIPQLSLGAAYRSKIKIDYTGTATFQQRLTGNPVFDAAVAAQLPQGTHPVNTFIDFPSTVNLGGAISLPWTLTVALEADWTEWSRFHELDISLPDLSGGKVCQPAGIEVCRPTNWSNSWAYRAGIEKKFGFFAVRAGYYKDKTPQPVEDAGPVLADNDRNGYTLGLGYDTERWGVDISDIYLKFKDRDTRGSANHDKYFGVFRETANIFAFSFRVAF